MRDSEIPAISENDPQSVVLEHLAAFNAHDTVGLLRGFTEETVWVTGTDRTVGLSALRELFGGWLWERDPSLTLRTLLVGPTSAAVELTEDLVIDGRRRSYPIAVFLEIDDGRISAARVYREGSAAIG